MRERILFLTPRVPWPLDSGGNIVTARILRELVRDFKVDVWCLWRKGETLPNAAIERALGGVHLKVVRCPDRRRSPINFARSIMHGLPLNVFRNRSPEFAREVYATIREYSLLVVDHYEMYQYVPLDYAGQVIFVEHNIESNLWERYASLPVSFLIRLAAHFEARRIRIYEQRALQRSTAVICLSEEDVSRARALVRERPCSIHHVPVVGDTTLLSYPALQFSETQPVILFVGTLTWEPNVDGLCAFINENWEDLRRALPGVQFRIVGRNPHPRLQAIAQQHDGVYLVGYRESLEEEYRTARVVAVPLRFGGGVKVKVVNALMRGIPVVSTPVGMEGIAGEQEYGGVATSISHMVDILVRAIQQQDFWTNLSVTGRNLVKHRFGDEVVHDALLRAIKTNKS